MGFLRIDVSTDGKGSIACALTAPLNLKHYGKINHVCVSTDICVAANHIYKHGCLDIHVVGNSYTKAGDHMYTHVH